MWINRKEFEAMQHKLAVQEFDLLRLKQYDVMMEKLKGFDWFEMSSGGGICAHEKNEPQSDYAIYGTLFTVPYEMCRLIQSSN